MRPPFCEVFTDIADDIRELQSEPEFQRVAAAHSRPAAKDLNADEPTTLATRWQ
jgi:hypothetical protein